MSEVFLDGKYVGYVEGARTFAEKLVNERRMGKISSEINVCYNAVKFIYAIIKL